MLTFLIGPSHAGKSTLVEEITIRFPDVVFINLDIEIAKLEKELRELGGTYSGDWKGRWQRSLVVFDRVGIEARRVVVDVGAGSLQTPEAFQYFRQRVTDIILIWAPFEAILSRHPGRDPEDLRRLEFSDSHKSLYDGIDRRINTSELDAEKAARLLAEHLTEVHQRRQVAHAFESP